MKRKPQPQNLLLLVVSSLSVVVLALFLFILGTGTKLPNIETPGEIRIDPRNFYGISWVGNACDNIDYAKSMGYDYVFYQRGMESCPNAKNIWFYLESVETTVYPSYAWQIDYTKTYSADQIKAINDLFVWKSSDTFPKNLATGWFFSSTAFRPNPDFQRQTVIDKTILSIKARIKSVEKPENNFLFGGFSWDVPDLQGDFWTGKQSEGGKIVTLAYWNPSGVESGIKHTGITYDYPTYSDARAELYKKLFIETKKDYPNFYILYEPYGVSGWFNKVSIRTDVKQIQPINSIICQESAGTDFVTNTAYFTSGFITPDRMCSTTPDTHDYTENLKIAGNAGKNGAWFTWFGRFGGNHGTYSYQTIKDVPDRLKLVRVIPGWDNLNNIALNKRSFDSTNLIYSSTNSHIDMYVMYSIHPKNQNIYAVVMNKDFGYIELGTKRVANIYKVDSLFRKFTLATTDFEQKGSKLYLKDSINQEKGYIVELK